MTAAVGVAVGHGMTEAQFQPRLAAPISATLPFALEGGS
jgi:hypothetical protein